MILLSISTVVNFGFLLLILAFIIWFFASNAINKLLSNHSDKPKSGSLKVVNGKKVISFSKGFNINLDGKTNKIINNSFVSTTFAIKPEDFKGFQPIPKMMVKEGDNVKAGEKLFYDRKKEGIFVTAPVSGKVKEIKRGAKRRITEVIIEADSIPEFKQFSTSSNTKEEIIDTLIESGAFVSFISRPFGYPAMPNQNPKAIFISAFDTSPLAADNDFIFEHLSKIDFQKGLDIIAKIAKTHLNINPDSSKIFTDAKNVQINYFQGADPAGKVGVQIHHIDAIKAGEVVWTIRPIDVVTIGKLFNEGIYDPQEIVAIAGKPFKKTFYVKTKKGVSIKSLVSGIEDTNRIISGNVLTGTQIDPNGFLGFNDNLLTVLKEGTEEELFGWLLPSYQRPTISKTFPWAEDEQVAFEANTNTHGEGRAFVVTGQYEEVLPMDIFSVHLLKSILVKDFEQMEGLGIYELLEEDLALCEFVCTSKQPVQQILREGLDYIHSQG